MQANSVVFITINKIAIVFVKITIRRNYNNDTIMCVSLFTVFGADTFLLVLTTNERNFLFH